MHTRAITAMTAFAALVAVGACSKTNDSTSGGDVGAAANPPAMTDSAMGSMSTTTTVPMTQADSVRADSIRADSLRADSLKSKTP